MFLTIYTTYIYNYVYICMENIFTVFLLEVSETYHCEVMQVLMNK